jgi:Tfp pilus assembly protein FimV
MMLRSPTPEELNQLLHLGGIGEAVRNRYDPVKAHQYYEAHKHLKGRHRGRTALVPIGRGRGSVQRTGAARARQKAELQARITSLSKKLRELENLIKEKEAVLKRDQASAKSTAKKERAAKEKNKPQTAAEKAKAARDAKKYRKSHSQQLKNKAKQASNKSGGSGSAKKGSSQKPNEMHIKDLKALASKVRGQLAVAKQKLAAL